MGARVVRNIRQVKLAFSGAYAPVIARLHEQGERGEMCRTFSTVTRWTTTIGLPLALIVGLLRKDLLLLFHNTFTFDATFMLLLLIPPVLSCCFGLAGNIVVMTGHAKWNLFNSVTAGGLNAVLNYLLIPRYGLMGAAAATVTASVIVTALQLIEARYLVEARLSPSLIYKPYLAVLMSGAAVWVISGLLPLDGALWARIAAAACALGIYIAGLYALGLSPKDKAALKPGMLPDLKDGKG
jgi:O-antigen/teichoic acid export membrane protein